MHCTNLPVPLPARRRLAGVGTLLAVALTTPTRAQCESEQLLASDGNAGTAFGTAAAADGDTAIVGAGAFFDAVEAGPGAAYVLRLDAETGSWLETARLAAGDAADGDNFGYSVDVSGGLAIVGAYTDDDRGENSGSAYVFARVAEDSDVWIEVAKLTAADGSAHDWFGSAVAIHGDTALVGAYLHDDPTDREGAAYVFQRDAGGPDQWGQVTKLAPDDRVPLHGFGFAVDLDGDVAVIGAISDDAACGGETDCESGAVYVFERDLGGLDAWGQRQKLTASDAERFDTFGAAVALDGGRLAIGAIWEDEAGADAGAAYVFERSDTTWSEVVKLTAGDARAADQFGWTVSVHADQVLVGRLFDFVDTCTDPGAAYVFDRNAGGADQWGQIARLASVDGDENDRFGDALALGAGVALVGAPGRDDAGDDAGALHVFTLTIGDCNANGRCDDLDIATGASADENDNGVPDECENLCPSDIDGSGAVDFADLLTLLADWGPCS